MNGKTFGRNFARAVSLVLFAGILFSGCSQQNVAVNDNVSINNSTAAAINTNAAPTNSNIAVSQNKEVLWDFRKVSADKPQTFSKAETDVVLKYLLGDSWDKEMQIASRISGSFTKANAKETLYFVSGCEDDKGVLVSNNNSACSHANWDSAGWIAIFDDKTPVAKIKASLGNRVEKATDVNGDGVSEILSFGGFTNMGETVEHGSFGQISGGKYQEIRKFDGWSSDCGSGISKDKKAVASVISYAPATGGKMPDFTEEYFQTKCENDDIGKNPQWNKITKKEFDDFAGSES